MFENYFDRISNVSYSFHFDIINRLIQNGDADTDEHMKKVLQLTDYEQRSIIIEHMKSCKKSCEKRLKNGDCLLTQPSSYDNSIAEVKVAKTAFAWFLESGTVNTYTCANPNRNKYECFSQHLLTLFYSKYLDMKYSKHSREQDNISVLFSSESEYDRYELVSLSSNNELLTTPDPPRIYDRKLNKTFTVQAVSNVLVNKLNCLYLDDKIGTLSFRLCNYRIYEGRYSIVPLMEAVEQGKKYSELKLNADNFVTKLYNDNCYNDALFVFSSVDELTFEEVNDDIEYEDDKIVTSVVHMKLCKTKDAYQITHIDHEYVFYTHEEYENKKKNNRQKGQGYKRIKTFKADNCSIPIDLNFEVKWKEQYQEERYELIECSRTISFIQFVLENCMNHIDLIQQYFE